MKRTAFVVVFVMIFAAALAGPLKIVTVKAPDINCLFDTDCKIVVDDMSSDITLPGATGKGFLQSRLWPVGEAGTPGQGLYAYLYRIDVRQPAGTTNIACVTEMTIDFGPVRQLDYDKDGKLDQVFVITKGGLGTIKPVSAIQSGSKITFLFNPGACAGSAPGKGQSTFFFGLASAQPHRTVTAELKTAPASVLSLAAYAPLATPPPSGSMRTAPTQTKPAKQQ
jgi:hypothetical protein